MSICWRRHQSGVAEPSAQEVQEEGGAGEQHSAVAHGSQRVEQPHPESVHSTQRTYNNAKNNFNRSATVI